MANINTINLSQLKTSDCYTGILLSENQEDKIKQIKEQLIKKALKKHKNISMCSPICFQIYKQKLLFWFNIGKTTNIISKNINIPLV